MSRHRAVLVVSVLTIALSMVPVLAARADHTPWHRVTLSGVTPTSGPAGQSVVATGVAMCAPVTAAFGPLSTSVALAAVPRTAQVVVRATYTTRGGGTGNDAWSPVPAVYAGFSPGGWTSPAAIPADVQPDTDVYYTATLICEDEDGSRDLESNRLTVHVDPLADTSESPTPTPTGSATPSGWATSTASPTTARSVTANPSPMTTPAPTTAKTATGTWSGSPSASRPASRTASPRRRRVAAPPDVEPARRVNRSSPSSMTGANSSRRPTPRPDANTLPYTGGRAPAWLAAAGLACLAVGAALVLTCAHGLSRARLEDGPNLFPPV